MTALPDSHAKSSRRRSTAGGDARPGSDMPIASADRRHRVGGEHPGARPFVGHAARSISPSSFSVIVPAGARADRLEHAHDVERLVLVVPGRIEPP